QTEYEHCEPGIEFPFETGETAEILHALVHHREADDRVDHVRVCSCAGEDASHQGKRVADGEHRDIDDHVSQSVQKEHDTNQEQYVIVSRDHVFGPEIHEGN